MSKKIKINSKNAERCLLTEVMPFETPIIFSNWGSYNYFHKIQKTSVTIPPSIKKLLEGDDAGKNKRSIPYQVKIKKDISEFRSLHVVHPKHSMDIINLYQSFDVKISKLCRKSDYSIRSPYHSAKLFVDKNRDVSSDVKSIEELDENRAYASSYFAYKKFAHLYKFFDSDIFGSTEKRFSNLKYVDISKFFPSIYTHSITWAIIGKFSSKNLPPKDKSLGSVLDSLMQEMNYGETNGIVVGPELSRIFAEIIMQRIDFEVEKNLRERGLELGLHYCCFRFVDDFFIFYNNSEYSDIIINVLSSELERYKLYINHGKIYDQTRPFITDISEKKIQLSKYLKDLYSKIFDTTEQNNKSKSSNINAYRELNSIRSIVKGCEQKIHAFSNFYLKSLHKHILKMNSNNGSSPNNIMLYIDLAFHWVSMDIRVSSIIKLSSIVNSIAGIIDKDSFSVVERNIIKGKIHSEIEMLIENVSVGESLIEASNLLILLAKIDSESRHLLPLSIIEGSICVSGS